MTTEDSTFREDAEVVRQDIYWPDKRVPNAAHAALDRILTSYESMKRENERMESIVDSYVSMGPTNTEAREMLLDALSRLTRYEEALRKTHGIAQAMADLDSWIAKECGMEDDGTNWFVPAARNALSEGSSEGKEPE